MRKHTRIECVFCARTEAQAFAKNESFAQNSKNSPVLSHKLFQTSCIVLSGFSPYYFRASKIRLNGVSVARLNVLNLLR